LRKLEILNPDFDPKQCTAEFINQDTPSQLMEKRPKSAAGAFQNSNA